MIDPFVNGNTPGGGPPAALSREQATLVSGIRTTVATQMVAQGKKAAAGGTLVGLDREMFGSELIVDQLRGHAQTQVKAGRPNLSVEEERAVFEAVFELLFGLGTLGPLLRMDNVLNINANGCDEVWLEYDDGTKGKGPPLANSDTALIEMIQQWGKQLDIFPRSFDYAHPSINLPLPNGDRLFATAWTSRRPHLCVRRHPLLKMSMDKAWELRYFDRGIQSLLDAAVKAHLNVTIAGPQAVGKTTLARALGSACPVDERIVTIETDYELGFDRFPDQHSDVVALQARPASTEGVGEKGCYELMFDALRMDARRVIVGEVRGPEVQPMLDAMSTGHRGSIATVHANSADHIFERLGILSMLSPARPDYETAQRQIAVALDLVVYLSPNDGGRPGGYVSQVMEVHGFDHTRGRATTTDLCSPGPDGRGVLVRTVSSRNMAALVAAGYERDKSGGWHR